MLEILIFYESYLHSNVDNKNNNAWSQNKTDFYFDEAIACSDTHTRKYSWHFSEKRWQLISQTLAGKELISPTVSLELLTMALMCADLRHTIAQTRRLAAWKRAVLCGFRPRRRLWGLWLLMQRLRLSSDPQSSLSRTPSLCLVTWQQNKCESQFKGPKGRATASCCTTAISVSLLLIFNSTSKQSGLLSVRYASGFCLRSGTLWEY